MIKSRIIVAYSISILVILVLALRYGYLQIVVNQSLLQKAINNYSSVVSTQPVRGLLIDSESVILVENKLSYAVAILPKDSRQNTESIFNFLSRYTTITELEKKKYYKQLSQAKNYDWVIIKDGLSDKEVSNLVANNYLESSLSIFARIKRYYPFHDLYSHSIGYVGRVSSSDKKKLESSGVSSNYLANDYVGKSGIEQYYESYLRGTMGKKTIRTDVYGNEVGLIDNVPAQDGYTIKLTLNSRLQKKADELLGRNKGAIVALDPQTGGILAFVSKPSYDANLFLDGISPDEWDELRNNQNNPLLNRCSQGTYPPGSTFKPFLAAVALYTGVRTTNYIFHDIGYFTLPGSTHKFRNSGNEVLGNINILEAVAHSSDAFFYKLGLDMGVDRMHSTLSMFGLGVKTGIDLPQENKGLLPSKEWKAKRFANNPYQKNWLPADSVTMGIGQGFNNYTPLQMAFATSILANNGVAMRPHFISQILGSDGSMIESYTPISYKIPISSSDLNVIRHGMELVMQKGTGARVASGITYTIAGKTGTAQVVGLTQKDRKAKFTGSKYKDHSWFIAYAPAENPKIAIAVIVENAGFGAAVAGPIVRKLLDSYILNQYYTESNMQGYKKFIPRDEESQSLNYNNLVNSHTDDGSDDDDEQSSN